MTQVRNSAETPMLIGLTGYAQHGKDSVAKVLVEEFGFTRFAFADALKHMALVLNPIIGELDNDEILRLSDAVEALGWEGAKQDPEVRRFLQVLGTEGARATFGDDCWVLALDDHINRSGASRVVISDVRFPNEGDFVYAVGGEVWRITRVNQDGTPYDNGLGTAHASESGVANIGVTREIVAADLDGLAQAVRGKFRQAEVGFR